MPKSVALVGASDRPGSLGRSVFENLRGGAFKGDIYAVNPRHRARVRAALLCERFGDRQADRSRRDHRAGGRRPRTPGRDDRPRPRRCRHVHAGRDRRRGRARMAARRFGSGQETRISAWSVPGPSAIIRTDIGLNATFGTTPTLPGRLALVSQSGAVCTAMLDFAAPMHIGFSSVLSLGGAVDVSFGELLDALVQDVATDGILLYVESVGDARAFMSALRAAARIKPVVVLKAGRSLEPMRDPDGDDDIAPMPDTVFNAALQRAGPCACARTRNCSPPRASWRWARFPAATASPLFPTGADPDCSPRTAPWPPASRSPASIPRRCRRWMPFCPRKSCAPIRSTCAPTRRRRGSRPRSRPRCRIHRSTRCSRCT